MSFEEAKYPIEQSPSCAVVDGASCKGRNRTTVGEVRKQIPSVGGGGGGEEKRAGARRAVRREADEEAVSHPAPSRFGAEKPTTRGEGLPIAQDVSPYSVSAGKGDEGGPKGLSNVPE